MSRIFWFLPACAALLLAVALMVLGTNNPPVRMAGVALGLASLVLGRWAQKRAPLPKRGLGQGALVVLYGVIFLATLAMIVFMAMLKG